MAEFCLIVAPHTRPDGMKHSHAFEVQLAGDAAVLCVSEMPLFSAARVLLKTGKAKPDDVLVMRHAGAKHGALRGKVGVAAGLSIEDRPSGQRIRLAKYQQRTNAGPPRIAQNDEGLPEPRPTDGAASVPAAAGREAA